MIDSNAPAIELKAYAKINLFLEILDKRDDGFHELVTVMQEVDLADSIILEETANGVFLSCDDPDIPTGEDNLICKAANLLKSESGTARGAKILLNKRIPVGAGLGGGSSDAACTLRGLNKLWKLGFSDNKLMDIASEIGSDVPFFINGNTAICSGRGEKISPIKVHNEYIYVIIYPNLKISTAEIYKNLKLGLTKDRKDVNFFLTQMDSGDSVCLGNNLFNRLSETILKTYPNLHVIINVLKKYNFCGLQISGSGSSLFGLCERRCDAEVIKKELDKLDLAKVFVASNYVGRN